MEQRQTANIETRPAAGFAAFESGGPILPWKFERRATLENDVAVKILYCGICHTDLHAVNNPTGEYPLIPGHEITGEVVEVGKAVTRFSVGDKVLIGNIVDSCGVCEPCQMQMEPYCRAFPTLTFGGLDLLDGSITKGGYSDLYVANEKFVYHLPEGMDAAGAAPLVCAGITTYSPLKHWQIGPGKTVGIIGIGGLGHLAIKFARAMGAYVVAFTTSPAKVGDALQLGAHEVVLSTDEAQMKAQAFRFDFILDNISKTYPMNPYLLALKIDGTLCSLGIPSKFDFDPILLTMGRRNISSSGSGGTRETQEMLEFCQQHNIVADVEVIGIGEINEAFSRLEKGEVHYRFVIDMSL